MAQREAQRAAIRLSGASGHRAPETRMLILARRAVLSTVIALAALIFTSNPLLAAEGSESGWGGVWLFIGRVANLAVVAILLVWVARKPLANFYASRTESIREQLAEAQRARADAEARLAAIESRMSRLDQELSEMKAASEQDARAEYARLTEAADEEARKVVARARHEIAGMTREAYLGLKAHAAALAVEVAEKRIREVMTDEDHNRLVSKFVSGLGDAK
ncbi:MAG: ATP synthase F0 subunit B [Acidobacteria bacterium]|nr:ATP synthase F0 subunit B [Acidobacteriota bacterium]